MVVCCTKARTLSMVRVLRKTYAFISIRPNKPHSVRAANEDIYIFKAFIGKSILFFFLVNGSSAFSDFFCAVYIWTRKCCFFHFSCGQVVRDAFRSGSCKYGTDMRLFGRPFCSGCEKGNKANIHTHRGSSFFVIISAVYFSRLSHLRRVVCILYVCVENILPDPVPHFISRKCQ